MTSCTTQPTPGRRGLLAPLLVTLLLAVPTPAAPETQVSATLHARVADIREGTTVAINASTIASDVVLPALYARRNYTPVWSNPAAVQQLISAIEHSDRDGLDPADYNLATLERLLERNNETGDSDPEHTANLDLLLTDSLIRLGYHLSVGKVDPEELDSDWTMARHIGDLEALLQKDDAIEHGRVEALLQSLPPRAAAYPRLKQALATYRLYRQLGGWQSVPAGPALKVGMSGPRVLALRARLVATHDLTTQDMFLPSFDDAVEAGVKYFQRRHGLAADGIVGRKTLAELNVPVEIRIAQIRANLERARWILRDLPDTYLMVDIAGFNVRLVRHDAVVWETRAVVGQPYRMSPEFRSTLTYLDLNPTWTVPPTVLEEDLLPELRRDPGVLSRKDMVVVDYQGNPVDASRIDWRRYSGRSFPWLIRQQPGPKNALGRIKFMFPNRHSVYLHDTPGKSLFAKPARAFSSGCIRIERPYELAELLLRGNAGWDRTRLQQAIDSLQTRTISLQQPITILLAYWTVSVDDDGTIRFSRDIYQRDPPIIRGLSEPFRFHEREHFHGTPAMTALR